MREPALDFPADRLDQLERQLHRATSRIRALQWSFLVFVLACVCIAVVLFQSGALALGEAGVAVSKTVNSKEYGLYNRDGKRVILVDYDKFGLPNLVFMDLDLNYKMGIKVWPEGGGTPGVVFYDGSGVRGNFRMEANGETVLNLLGEKRKGGIAMTVARDGMPSLKLTDNTGKVLFEAPASSPNDGGGEGAAPASHPRDPATGGNP